MSVVVNIHGVDKSEKAFRAVNKNLQKVTLAGKNANLQMRSLGSSVQNLSRSFFNLRTAMVALIPIMSVKLAGSLEKGVAEISTLLDEVTFDTVPALTRELERLSSVSGLAIQPMIKARYDIVSAGFFDIASSAILMEEAAKLAIGGVVSAAGAADILTTAVNAYGIEVEDASQVSDILFHTVKNGKTTMLELSNTLGRLLPNAKLANVALDDVGSAMAVLTASGINTFESATAMRMAFKSLVAPTTEAASVMRKLNFELFETEEGTLDLVKTFAQFRGMDPQIINALIPELRAVTAVKTLSDQLVKLNTVIKASDNIAGDAQVAMDIMLDTWDQSWARFINNMQNVMRTLGRTIIQGLRPILDAVNIEMLSLFDIGFENVGKAIIADWSKIMSTLLSIMEATIDLFPAMIEAALKFGFNNALPFIMSAMEILFQLVDNLAMRVVAGIQMTLTSVFTGIKNGLIEVNNLATPTLFEGATTAANNFGIAAQNAIKRALNAWQRLVGAKEFELFDAKRQEEITNYLIGLSKGLVIEPDIEVEKLIEKLDKINKDLKADLLSISAVDPTLSLKAQWEAYKEFVSSLVTDLYNDVKLKARAFSSSDTGMAEWFKKVETQSERFDPFPNVEKSFVQTLRVLGVKLDLWVVKNQDKLNEWADTLSQFGAKFGQLGDAITANQDQKIDQSTNKRIAAIDAEEQAAIEALDNRALLTEARASEMARIEEEFAEKRAAAEEKAEKKKAALRKKLKPLMIAEALANTAAAVIKSLPNLALAGIVASIGAIQVATIAAQKFFSGGLVTQGSGTKDDVPTILSKGEFVLRKSAVDQIGPSNLRQLNSDPANLIGSLSPAGGDSYNIQVQAMDSESFMTFMSRNPNAFARGLQEAMRRKIVTIENDTFDNTSRIRVSV